MQPYLLLLCLCATGTEPDKVSLKEIGVTLPRSVASLTYKGKHHYQPRELGYSVAYSSATCLVTLYVYDQGQKEIPDGKASGLVQDQLQAALKDVKTIEQQGHYKNVKLVEGALPLPKAVMATFATAGFTFDVKGGGCKGYVLLLGRRNHLLKVRVTQYVVGAQTNDEEMHGFLATLVKLLKEPAQDR